MQLLQPGSPALDTFTYTVSDGEGGTATTNLMVTANGAADNIVSGATGGANTLNGTNGNDIIQGLGGGDTLNGRQGNDFLDGGLGNDMIQGGDGADILLGGAGRDELSGGNQGDILNGGADRDTVSGGAGNDTIVAAIGDGDDAYDGNGGTDTYSLAGTTAAATVNLETGRASSSETGTDTLSSIENVIGGSGNDKIIASAGWNVFLGGDGSDTFVFRSEGAAGTGANRDQIGDFTLHSDIIDVTGIDANGNLAGSPAFAFVGEIVSIVGGVGHLGRGQIGYHYETIGGVDHTIVEGNVNANPAADFQIDLVGRYLLRTGDFFCRGIKLPN